MLSASSPQEWVEAVLRLFGDPVLRLRLGSEGRRYVEDHHRWERCLEPFGAALRAPRIRLMAAVAEAAAQRDARSLVDAETEGGDDLPFLRFADNAQEYFYLWWTGLEAKVRSGQESPALESHLSKYRSLITFET